MSNSLETSDPGTEPDTPWWDFTDDDVYERTCPECYGNCIDDDGDPCSECFGEGVL